MINNDPQLSSCFSTFDEHQKKKNFCLL